MGTSVPEELKHLDLVAIDCFLLIYLLVMLAFYVCLGTSRPTNNKQQREYY
jgi:hypothetical protein